MPGYPFRGSIHTDEDKDTCVLQVRNTDPTRPWMALDSSQLSKTCLTGRRRPDYLRSQDVVFLARGANNYAICINSITDKVVCTPHFFHIRLCEEWQQALLPAFLAWQINQSPAQGYFARCAQGSVAPNVSKQQLAELTIVIPTLEKQYQIINLVSTIQKEQQLYKQLINNRKQLEQAVSQDILNQTRGKIYE